MKIILLLAAIIGFTFAQDLDELDLFSDLESASQISTKTKLNINKTPSIISVLHASELKQLGATNLFEALENVPGIQTYADSVGTKQISMRGNKSVRGDKLKLMINGISANTEILGTSYFYMDMPIENIERIEIIRGPASTIYGSFAHVGTINVITKSSRLNENIYFVSTSSQNTTNLGFTQNIALDSVKIALDTSFTQNKNSRQTGPYIYDGGSIDSARSYEDFTNSSVGSVIEFNDDFSFQARLTQLDSQNFYGYASWPILSDPKKLKSTSILAEALYSPSIDQDTSFDWRLGYKEYIFDGYARLKPLTTTTALSVDLIGRGYYKEHVYYTDATLNYTLDEHEILLGVYLSQSKESSQTTYHINDFAAGFEDTTVLKPGVKANITREQYALYFNDIYTMTDKVLLNFGLRFDNYNDVKSNLAHKLALLYNQDEKQNYKFMYQRSFRAPSWLELYGTTIPYIGNESIKSETIDTFEIAYNYQNSLDSFFRLNFFYSILQDFINRNDDDTFYNDSDRDSYGAELEVKLKLLTDTSLQMNYSYVHAKDSDGNDISLIANHLANLMLLHDFNKHFSLGSRLKYIGKKQHDMDDSRSALGASLSYDQTLTYTHNEFSIQASLKNVFDTPIFDASPYGNGTSTSGVGTYTQDYRRNGRTLWISAQWRFE